MDDVTSLADLIEQLERKRTILVDLDRQISTGVSDDDLEAEILESEEIQSELSSTMARVKRLMQQFQQVLTHSPRSSSPSQVQQTTRSPSQVSQTTTRSSSPASSETNTLPTPPQSPVHKEDMAHHHSTRQNPPQRSTSDLDVSDASHTKLHEPQLGINSTVRLPRLDLPTFSGNALEWQPFWDGFNAAVNSNPSISDVQKLNYLRSQLRGEASLVIAGFSLTSANYSHSVVLLKDHYGQPQKLITAHMQALLDLPHPSNTLSSLQSFHDAIERHMRSLSTLGKSVDSYGDLLVPIILSKLPQKTRKNMVRDHDRNEWNLRDLQEAIRKEVRVFESELVTSHPPQNLHPTATFHTGATNNPSQPNAASQRSCTCAFCKGSHSPTKCEVITNRQARKEFVVQKNLCFNCLGRHKVNICKLKHRCCKCNRKHHTSLCTVDSDPEKQDKKESTTDNTTLSTIVSPPATATSLIIYSVHCQMFHAGTNTTLTAIRQQFWIPTARQRIKSLLRHCTTCWRHGGKPYATPDPPPLPEIRTRDSIPFTITGIDFTGALYICQNSTEIKVYICLFICATSRAVHLEVVTDLTVETFLLAFRRFTSRRSVPKIVVSDNASTYLAAADELQRLLQSDHLTELLGRQGVLWHFIPKRAPWYGGWWERLIGLTKISLKKVLGRSRVTLPVLQTLVAS